MHFFKFSEQNLTLNYWWNTLISYGLKVVAAIVIFIVGRFLIRWGVRSLTSLLNRRHVDPAVVSFVRSFANIILLLLLTLAILSQLGIEVVSFAALLASMGVAVGMALSSDLKNLAGGIVLLVTRPVRVGDFIETNMGSGTVEEIQIIHTVLRTAASQRVYIPNGLMSSNAITNYSMMPNRRLEWVIGVEYNTDMEKVKAEIQDLLSSDSRILEEPAPVVFLKELNDSSVDILVRAWTSYENYWDVYYSFNERVYERFNSVGISFPFPSLSLYSRDS